MSDEGIQPPPGFSEKPSQPRPDRSACPECGSPFPGDPNAVGANRCWLCHAGPEERADPKGGGNRILSVLGIILLVFFAGVVCFWVACNIVLSGPFH